MRHASRSIYLALHTTLSLLARTVRGAPLIPTLSTFVSVNKRALAEALNGGEITGYVLIISLLVVLSGITAGLTLGLMSLDETQLYVLSQSGSAKQKRHAAKIIPIRKNGHLLLVSLLLLNVVSNETLPIISEKILGSGVTSVVSSTVMIVIFSEILPQAICSTHGLAIGAAMVVPVKIAIVLMFVVAWPVAKLLDLILGENHGMVYRRAELKELIDFHSKQAQHGGDLSIDAVTIMRGALDLQEKKVKNSLTYIDDVFMLHSQSFLDRATIQRIIESGHSRIPIYDYVDDEQSQQEVAAGHYSEVSQRRKIIGCLLAKNLLLIDPDDNVPLSKVSINHIPSVQDDLPLFDILNIFQEGRSHLAVVVSSPPAPLMPTAASSGGRAGSRSSSETVIPEVNEVHLWTDEEMSKLEPIGIITLEDVLEELIQEPIWDETDTAEPRPRAGLAVPLQGTGGSLILATNRGRPVSRRDTPDVYAQSLDRSASASLEPASSLSTSQIELVTLRRAAGIEKDLTSYQLSRSNSAAPADAKLFNDGDDPFADERNALASQMPTLRPRGSQSNMRSVENKHLSGVRPSRPLGGVVPVRADSGSTGHEKNRFKSRSSSSTEAGVRRTQSAHTPSSRTEHAHRRDSPLRSSPFTRKKLARHGSRSRDPPITGSDLTTEGSDDDVTFDHDGMSMSAHNIGRDGR